MDTTDDKHKQRADEIAQWWIGNVDKDAATQKIRLSDKIESALSEAVAEERERCAKLAHPCGGPCMHEGVGVHIAAKIREGA